MLIPSTMLGAGSGGSSTGLHQGILSLPSEAHAPLPVLFPSALVVLTWQDEMQDSSPWLVCRDLSMLQTEMQVELNGMPCSVGARTWVMGTLSLIRDVAQ